MAVTGTTYKQIVLGSFSAIIPIMVECIQGTNISNLDELEAESYAKISITTFYEFFGTAVSLFGGFGMLSYYTFAKYRNIVKDEKQKQLSGENSGTKRIVADHYQSESVDTIRSNGEFKANASSEIVHA